MRLGTKCSRMPLTFSIAVIIGSALALSAQEGPEISLAPSKWPKVATVDPRFVSYNVEMVEVTGGRFWKPYKSTADGQPAPKPPTSSDVNQPAGISPSLYQYRPPINLSNPRLRKLAEALGPSYVRVSGTWQNSTYFQDNDNPALTEVPMGFKGVLTRAEWKGVLDFANA